MFWKTDARYQPGKLVGAFLLFYGIFRFAIEFIREPDSQFAGDLRDRRAAHGPMAVAADDPGRAVPDADRQEAASSSRGNRWLRRGRLTPFEHALRERIEAEGPITVEAYMEACNAHYYATRDPLGAAGDFTTAPEVSQMFGEMVGAALADCWTRAGAPADAFYVELGPGRGTLASDALRVLRGAGFEGGVHFIETSPVLREIQRKSRPDAVWHDAMENLPRAAAAACRQRIFRRACRSVSLSGDRAAGQDRRRRAWPSIATGRLSRFAVRDEAARQSEPLLANAEGSP